MRATQVLLLNKEAPTQTMLITKDGFTELPLAADSPILQFRDRVVYANVTYMITERKYDIGTNLMLLKTRQVRS